MYIRDKLVSNWRSDFRDEIEMQKLTDDDAR